MRKGVLVKRLRKVKKGIAPIEGVKASDSGDRKNSVGRCLLWWMCTALL